MAHTDEVQHRLTRCCTQPRWNVAVEGVLASFGSLPVMLVPLLARTPLPASVNQGSTLVCAPYFATEKLASELREGPTFATHPAIGMVMIGCAPFDFESLTKLSAFRPAVAGPSAMLSKYQSPPRLMAFACQLCRVETFPPHR